MTSMSKHFGVHRNGINDRTHMHMQHGCLHTVQTVQATHLNAGLNNTLTLFVIWLSGCD